MLPSSTPTLLLSVLLLLLLSSTWSTPLSKFAEPRGRGVTRHNLWHFTVPSGYTLPLSFHLSPSNSLTCCYTCLVTSKNYTIPCDYSRPLTHATPRLKVVLPVPVRRGGGKVAVVPTIVRGKFKEKWMGRGVVKFWGYVEGGGEVRGRRMGGVAVEGEEDEEYDDEDENADDQAENENEDEGEHDNENDDEEKVQDEEEDGDYQYYDEDE